MKLILPLVCAFVYSFSYGQFTYEKFEQITRDFYPGSFTTTDGEVVEGQMKVACEVHKIQVKTGENKIENIPSRKIETCIIDSAEIHILENISFYNYSLMGRTLPMKVYAVLLEKGKYNCYLSEYTEYNPNTNQRLVHSLYIVQNEADEKLLIPFNSYIGKRKNKKLKSKLIHFCPGIEAFINDPEVFKHDFRGLERFVRKCNEVQ